MRAETEAKLSKITHYPWFQSCGQPLPATVARVDSWRAAVQKCDSLKWRNHTLMAHNALNWSVQQRSWERTHQWNVITVELRNSITAFLQGLLSDAPVPPELRGSVMRNVQWCLLHICLEEEYRDLVEPVFFQNYLDPWYAKGHFPCGWDGKGFPDHWDGVVREGKLIVF